MERAEVVVDGTSPCVMTTCRVAPGVDEVTRLAIEVTDFQSVVSQLELLILAVMQYAASP